ncbi:unnamed protein product [Protopolystoma xenopodis]|uniref:Uncharacterized protein n=1 Tax=Protopolystoma xenopodis TaxID=117903 RepID=A0A3S4ZBU7_9PLAT|nr:unnamed protein product [Protopolystoma xenopodis]
MDSPSDIQPHDYLFSPSSASTLVGLRKLRAFIGKKKVYGVLLHKDNLMDSILNPLNLHIFSGELDSFSPIGDEQIYRIGLIAGIVIGSLLGLVLVTLGIYALITKSGNQLHPNVACLTGVVDLPRGTGSARVARQLDAETEQFTRLRDSNPRPLGASWTGRLDEPFAERWFQ